MLAVYVWRISNLFGESLTTALEARLQLLIMLQREACRVKDQIPRSLITLIFHFATTLWVF